jgi:putative ABC transport system substrate-binding protein
MVDMYMRHGLIAWPLCVCCLAFGFLDNPPACQATEIVILKSADVTGYNQAVEGFKAEIPQATLTEYDLKGDVEQGRKFAPSIRASDPALIIAVGLKAALVAKLELLDIPVIFCMVFDPEKYELPAPNMTGIIMAPPIRQQLSALHMVLPQARRVGVLYDPAKTTAAIEGAAQQAKALGLELIARQVKTKKDVPLVLGKLISQVDVLVLIPDSTVLTEESFGFILGSALEAKVPVIGFSSELVKSGALLGVSVSYTDVGRQAGLLAKKILKGQAIEASSPLPSSLFRMALNLKTAKFLELQIPPEVVNRADTVY